MTKIKSLGDVYGVRKGVDEEGIEVQFANGATVWIRRAGNPDWADLENRLLNKLKSKSNFRRGNISVEDAREHSIELISRASFTGWKDMFDNLDPNDLSVETKELNEIPFSPKNAAALLKRYPQFLEEANSVAHNFALYSREDSEADAKN